MFLCQSILKHIAVIQRKSVVMKKSIGVLCLVGFVASHIADNLSSCLLRTLKINDMHMQCKCHFTVFMLDDNIEAKKK
jgi:hypothetical protein